MHLSPEQISYLYPVSHIEVMGNDWRVIRERAMSTDAPVGGRRSEVVRLSKRSLGNMLWSAKELDFQFLSMLTLTYGVVVPIDGREAKSHLNAILQLIRDRLPKMYYFWFMEFTKAGRVHFHILLSWKVRDSWRRLVARSWSRITTSNVSRETIDGETIAAEREKIFKVHSHPRAWSDVRKPDGAIRYIAKYAMKTEQKEVPKEYRNCGRFWGRSRDCPKKEKVLVCVTELEVYDKLLELGHPSTKFDLLPKYIFDVDRRVSEEPQNKGEDN